MSEEQLTKIVSDGMTGEQRILSLTPEEIEQRRIDIAAAEERLLQIELDKQAKDSALASAVEKLSASGLTAEEINALRGL